MQENIVSERLRTSEEQKVMLKNLALPLLEEQLAWYEHITGEQIGRQS